MTMNEIEIPPFDALIGSEKPTDSFGGILENAEFDIAMLRFEELANQAIITVCEMFDINLSDPKITADELDGIISEMWSTGWNPEEADFNLFCSHYGTILASLMKIVPNTSIVFRSSSNINHLSIWHESSKTEYFPFHKIAKCLTRRHGESVRQMIGDLKQKEFGEQGHSL